MQVRNTTAVERPLPCVRSRGLRVDATNEPRFLLVGQIKQAVWTATVTYRHEEAIRIISVRRARDDEKAQYIDAPGRQR